jgi:hypothetical protein
MDPKDMENEEAAQPLMENKAEDKKSEGGLAMPSIPGGDLFGDGKSEDSDDEEVKPHFENCCCFVCVCNNDKTKELTCCGCLPMRCGIVTLGVFYFTLSCVVISWYFFMMLNEHIAWWFPAVALVLLAPLVTGTFFWVNYFIRDQRSTRGKLGVAC